MSETGIDRFAQGEATRQLREFFLYADPRPNSAAALTVTEPPPPDLTDAIESTGPETRLEHCIALQAKAVSMLEGERHTFHVGSPAVNPGQTSTALLALLKEAIRHERRILQEIHALRAEAGSLQTQRDELASALKCMETLSLTDELTGLPNRRAFVRRLDQELSRNQRTGQPLAMVLLDIDNFKNINDCHGHYTGDMILREFARSMARELRQHDLLARYGGEEFVLLLPETSPADARNAMEKLAHRLRQEPLETGEASVDLPTFSAGIACLRPGEAAAALINRADQALYLAKRRGRNRIESDEQLA